VQKNKQISRLVFWLSRIEDIIVATLLSSILLLAIAQIVLRNFFDSGIVWSETLLRILVLWIGLAGANLASRQGKQINIDVLSKYVPDRYKIYLITINYSFALIVCLLISYYSLQFVILEYHSQSMAFESVPAWLAESIIPISFMIMAIRYIAKIIVNIKLSHYPNQ